jgi:hypothetical protein
MNCLQAWAFHFPKCHSSFFPPDTCQYHGTKIRSIFKLSNALGARGALEGSTLQLHLRWVLTSGTLCSKGITLHWTHSRLPSMQGEIVNIICSSISSNLLFIDSNSKLQINLCLQHLSKQVTGFYCSEQLLWCLFMMPSTWGGQEWVSILVFDTSYCPRSTSWSFWPRTLSRIRISMYPGSLEPCDLVDLFNWVLKTHQTAL